MSLYPDNDKRHTRANELLSQCAEFQAKMCKAKDELEESAKAANEVIYEAYKKIEPTTPPLKDWNTEIRLTDKAVEAAKIQTWVVDVGGATAALFVSAKVYSSLKPLLESSNLFKGSAVAAEDAAAAAKAATVGSEEVVEEAGTKAAQDLAEKLIPEVLEVAEVEATEVTLSLGARIISTFLSGAAGLAAGAAVAVIAELISDAISGAIERTKLRKGIREGYHARLQLKLLDMKYEQLKEELDSCVNAFTVVTDPAIISEMTKEKLDMIAARIVEQHASKLGNITVESARTALKELDDRMGAWTDEDENTE